MQYSQTHDTLGRLFQNNDLPYAAAIDQDDLPPTMPEDPDIPDYPV